MSLVRTVKDMNHWLIQNSRKDKTLGFVPTMGYLHEGHISLIKRASNANDLVVVSIFVNPTQFAIGEDYESYPRDIERDYKLAVEAGADLVFCPEVNEIYLPGSSTIVEVTGNITKKLCGKSRPVHFKGVTTIVNILFHIVKPDRAYFGQKDAQQAIIVKKMVGDLHIPVEVVVCPIIREADGLAMSSRNAYLTPEERKEATCLNKALLKAEEYFVSKNRDRNKTEILGQIIKDSINESPLAKIDYVEILDAETLDEIEDIKPGKQALAAVAVKFGNTRLIDNRILYM